MVSKLLMSRVPRTLALAACAGVILATLAAHSLAAAARGVRVGSTPVLPVASHAIAALPASSAVNVTVALKPRDAAALTAFATAVATPGSPVYHDYLTTAQFAQRFGATTAQIAAVQSSLRAHGLHPGQ